MNFYKRYIGDYLRDTAALSVTENGAYDLLLDHCYATEIGLPADKESLYRICKAAKAFERAAVDKVLGRYFYLAEDGLWHQKRVDEEIEKRQHQVTVNRTVGLRGGRPKETESVFPGNRIGYFSETETEPINNPNHSQIPEPEKPVKGNGSKSSIGQSAPSAKRGTRLTPDWIPPKDWFDFCEQERPDLDSAEVYNKFHDHWTAKPGKDGVKLDWFATWRNWVRSEKR